jgi:hypothetical protein
LNALLINILLLFLTCISATPAKSSSSQTRISKSPVLNHCSHLLITVLMLA